MQRTILIHFSFGFFTFSKIDAQKLFLQAQMFLL